MFVNLIINKLGVNMDGLFIEGCRWDIDTMRLQESNPLELFSPVPVIWFIIKIIIFVRLQPIPLT